jgi:hypothetical protein
VRVPVTLTATLRITVRAMVLHIGHAQKRDRAEAVDDPEQIVHLEGGLAEKFPARWATSRP